MRLLRIAAVVATFVLAMDAAVPAIAAGPSGRSGPSAISADQRPPRSSARARSAPRRRACASRGAQFSARCFDNLVSRPRVAGILSDPAVVPGLADGRLSMNEIARQLRISDAVPRTRLGTEPDPEDDSELDLRDLDELRREDPVDASRLVLTRAGPIFSENFVPQRFPLVRMRDNPNYLDVEGFTLDLHDALSPNVNGYVMRMRQNGQTISTLQWNWARNPTVADAPAAAWNTDRRMHIVSLSKFMTAIGLVHMLRANGIDTQDRIIDYLPDYWTPGSNVDLINFEDLMNHLSGFSTGGSASDWGTMKSNVEGGVMASAVGSVSDYENMNFGLIRILMATIGGYISPDASFGSEWMTDLLWNIVSTAAYNEYMQANVFNPVGAFPVLTKSPSTALAHRYDASGTGWNTGSFQGSPGGVGWHMTINEVLDVARALRAGQIVSSLDAATILNQSWGLNSPLLGFDTDAGRLYYKPGRWQDASDASIARTEQCVLMMMPDNMEVVVFVNSPIGASGQNLTSLVRTLYTNNIVIVP